MTFSLGFGQEEEEEEAPSSIRPPIGALLPVSPHVSVAANIWLRRPLLTGYTRVCCFPVCLVLWLLHCLKVIVKCKCSLKPTFEVFGLIVNLYSCPEPVPLGCCDLDPKKKTLGVCLTHKISTLDSETFWMG